MPQPRPPEEPGTDVTPIAHNPHDRLFKRVFARPAEAASLLQAHLPPPLVAAIQWETLRCVRSEVQPRPLTGAGGARAADLVFEARLVTPDGEGDVQLAILLEHQSTPDPWMPVRLLGYLHGLLERQRSEPSRGRPMPVIPVVLYHGEAPWPAETSLADWLQLPPAVRALVSDFLPDFRYILEQRRPPHPDAYPEPTLIVRVVRVILDHGRNPEIVRLLMGWKAVLHATDPTRTGGETTPTMTDLIDYLYTLKPDLFEQLLAVLESSEAPGTMEIAMNTYQQAIDKGKQIGEELGLRKGEELGLRKGQRALLKRQCERRFGPLPQAADARIEAASEALLECWADNVLTAPTLDAVFGDPPN